MLKNQNGRMKACRILKRMIMDQAKRPKNPLDTPPKMNQTSPGHMNQQNKHLQQTNPGHRPMPGSSAGTSTSTMSPEKQRLEKEIAAKKQEFNTKKTTYSNNPTQENLTAMNNCTDNYNNMVLKFNGMK